MKLKILAAVMAPLLIAASGVYAETENMSVTTYYPAPMGVYKYVKLEPTPAAANDCNEASEEGRIFYDSTSGNKGMYVCGATGNPPICGGPSHCWQTVNDPPGKWTCVGAEDDGDNGNNGIPVYCPNNDPLYKIMDSTCTSWAVGFNPTSTTYIQKANGTWGIRCAPFVGGPVYASVYCCK